MRCFLDFITGREQITAGTCKFRIWGDSSVFWLSTDPVFVVIRGKRHIITAKKGTRGNWVRGKKTTYYPF